MGGPYTEFPNKTWNIEVTKPKKVLSSLDGVIKQLKKHIKMPDRICVIQTREGSYTVLRKSDNGEERLIDRNRKVPLIGRIIKIY